jgi:hypothetical protein
VRAVFFSSHCIIGCQLNVPHFLSLSLSRYAVSIRWEHEQQQQRRQRRKKSTCLSSTSSSECCKPYALTESFNTYFCCCARRVGSMFFLVEKKDGSPIVVAGPCWPFCTFVTVPLIVVLSGMVGYFIVSNPSAGLVCERFFCFYNSTLDDSQL